MYPMSPTHGVSAKMTDLTATACMLTNTSKHVMGQVVRPARGSLRLGNHPLVRRGRRATAVLRPSTAPVAPLQHEARAIEAAMALASRANSHRHLQRGPSRGHRAGDARRNYCTDQLRSSKRCRSAPARLSGCPRMYSANAGIMDMRTSRCALSTPETELMTVAQIELAHSYNMPALSVGHATDSWDLGFRGGVEDMAMALATPPCPSRGHDWLGNCRSWASHLLREDGPGRRTCRIPRPNPRREFRSTRSTSPPG